MSNNGGQKFKYVNTFWKALDVYKLQTLEGINNTISTIPRLTDVYTNWVLILNQNTKPYAYSVECFNTNF